MLNPLHKSIKTKINLGKYSCLCLLKMLNLLHKSIKTNINLGKYSCLCLLKMLNPLHKSIKTKINLGKYSCLCLLKMLNPVHKSIKKTKTNLGKYCFHVVIFNNNHFNFLRSSNTIGLNDNKLFMNNFQT